MSGAELANFAVPFMEDTNNDLMYNPKLARLIDQAQKFVLDGDAAEAVINVMRSKPSSLESTVPLARMPYPLMWVEMPGRARFYRKDAGVAEEDKPDRVGWLVEAKDNTCMSMSITSVYLSYSKNMVMVPLVKWMCDNSPNPFDWQIAMRQQMRDNAALIEISTGDYRKASDLLMEYWIHLHEVEIQSCARFHKTDVESVRRLYKRDFRLPATLFPTGFRDAITQSNKAFERLLAQSVDDTRGDNLLIRSFLALINSRNSIETEILNFDKQNKLARKRGREGAFRYEHKILKIKILERQKAYLRSQGLSEDEIRAEARASWVRGHPKVRKTGVFWWRPYMRGNREKGFIDTGYEVE